MALEEEEDISEETRLTKGANTPRETEETIEVSDDEGKYNLSILIGDTRDSKYAAYAEKAT